MSGFFIHSRCSREFFLSLLETITELFHSEQKLHHKLDFPKKPCPICPLMPKVGRDDFQNKFPSRKLLLRINELLLDKIYNGLVLAICCSKLVTYIIFSLAIMFTAHNNFVHEVFPVSNICTDLSDLSMTCVLSVPTAAAIRLTSYLL